jgi:hypothetical protein
VVPRAPEFPGSAFQIKIFVERGVKLQSGMNWSLIGNVCGKRSQLS